MATREKFFKSMRRQEGGYIPFEFELCPSLHKKFTEITGQTDYTEYYGFPVRIVEPENIGDRKRFIKYFDNVEDIVINGWGFGNKKGSVEHFTELVHPMKDFEAIEEFSRFPYPDPEKEYDWRQIEKDIAAIKSRDLVAAAHMAITIFEVAWYLRGMDRLLIDMAMEPELAEYHLDRITEIRCDMARRFAKAGCDILRLGDDVATQLNMMMSPGMWREFFKERLSKIIRAAKEVNPDVMIFYHGDGNMIQILPDLIEIGVDILNPIQPECMDPVEVKRLYGDMVSFWGTVGTQTTMPFGTPDEVRIVCRRMMEEVGRGGGLLLAPSHMVEPEVPWENIMAFIETVTEHNCRCVE
jgi:uroporphyrinogen decarboxylase